MSTEQSESAPAAQVEAKAAPAAVTAPQVETKAAPAADITQQATTPTATTQRKKDPKRVEAGKLAAEKRRQAQEEQKIAFVEAYHAEKQAKAATAAPKPAQDTKENSPNSGGLSANQWIATGGVGVSLLGVYYKREELMAMAKPVFDKFKTPKPAPELTPEPASVEPKPARDTRPRGFKKMV